MISRGRVLAGALALCAVLVCAFAEASASASALTAVKCEKVGAVEGELNSHCETGTTGEYKTVALPLNETVEGTAITTEEEPALRATIAGLNVTIRCAKTETIGGIGGNTEPSPGKHVISGKSERTTYSGCHTVLKTKETRFCAVEEVTGPNPGTIGMISTTALKGSTTGVEHQVRVEPAEAGLLSKFKILKKGSVPAEENECPFNSTIVVEVEGFVESEVNTTNHSHVTFTEANNGTGLIVAGAAAHYIATIGGFIKGTEIALGAQTFT